jgi:hypothetical protein
MTASKARVLAALACTGLVLAAGCRRAAVMVPAGEELTATTSAKASASEPFAFPADKGGALLAGELLPADSPARPGPLTERWPEARPPASVNVSDGPLPPELAISVVPQLSGPVARGGTSPHLVTAEDLEAPQERVELPDVGPLPAGPRVRANRPDPDMPPPLPTLARPVQDRASLEDPTLAASLAAALAASMPPRPSHLPFVRAAIPEPFEQRKPVGSTLPPELGQPVATTPRPPQ